MLPIAVARGVALRASAPGAPLHVVLDPERATQVVRNLVDNALEFTPKGGHVEVSVLDEGERFAVEVRDDGRRIAPSELPFVFDAFWRGGEGKGRAHGLGLGLAIVRHLVERQGGRVSAISDGIGHGATFRAAFSKLAAKEAAAREESPRESARAGLDGLEIVIAEDDVATLEATAAAMRRAGAVPRLAQSVSEALRLFEASLPDVLVSDIDLPDRDGLDLIRSVRAMDEPRSSLLAVAVTGLADPADRRRIQRAGDDACFAKPIVPALVAEHVSALLALLRTSPSTRPRRALVAGDDAKAVDMLADLLRGLEQRVAIATDAASLLQQTSADPPDLIFICVPQRRLQLNA
jgi:CheY-like chemotaxis protein